MLHYRDCPWVAHTCPERCAVVDLGTKTSAARCPRIARYFFHIFENGECTRDDVGIEMDTAEDVRREAMHALPEVAIDSVPLDGDRQAFTILAVDEDNRAVYTATLTFAGLWISLNE